MSSDVALIFATGCVSPVGLDTAQTCAAVRALQSGIEAAVPQAGDPLLAAAVPAKRALKSSEIDWCRQLARRALRECLQGYLGDPSRLALLICLPELFREHEITSDGTGHRFVAAVLRDLKLRMSRHSRVLLEGHASAAVAVEAAVELLAKDAIDAALIGGVDSLLNDRDRERLRAAGRLHEPGNPFGLIPGEASAFFLLGRPGGAFAHAPMAALVGAAHGQESDHLRTERYATGTGLREAIDRALTQAGTTEAAIAWRVSDMNGERHRGWESTVLLAREYRSWREGLPFLPLPSRCGDIGCASLPLQVIVAAQAIQTGAAPGALVVCESSSEGPLRGACLIAPAPGAPRPPFRSRVSGGLHDAGPVIARQLERLPHELAWLASRRDAIVRGIETLTDLEDFDARIDAHLSLLRTFGAHGWQVCIDTLDEVGPGKWFGPAVVAIQAGDLDRLKRVLAAAATEGEGRRNDLLCAFGWVSPSTLQDIVVMLAHAAAPSSRLLATAAIHMHRVKPGSLLPPLLDDADSTVRLRAIRLVGEVGVVAEAHRVLDHLHDGHDAIRLAAATSAVLLGERDRGLDTLHELATSNSTLAHDALIQLALSGDPAYTRRVLQQVASVHAAPRSRALIEACGAAGDPQNMPWLIECMTDEETARIATASFSLVTGLNLSSAEFARKGPGAERQLPNDDLDDQAVGLEGDANLPLPDVSLVRAWWNEHGPQMAAGIRHLWGRPAIPAVCVRILCLGTQRERRVAARLLAVLQPGSGLFPTSAPAWRQRERLVGLQADRDPS